jgi:hypothetical protein
MGANLAATIVGVIGEPSRGQLELEVQGRRASGHGMGKVASEFLFYFPGEPQQPQRSRRRRAEVGHRCGHGRGDRVASDRGASTARDESTARVNATADDRRARGWLQTGPTRQ